MNILLHYITFGSGYSFFCLKMDGYNADLESMNSAVSDMGSIMTDMSTIMMGKLKQARKYISMHLYWVV